MNICNMLVFLAGKLDTRVLGVNTSRMEETGSLYIRPFDMYPSTSIPTTLAWFDRCDLKTTDFGLGLLVVILIRITNSRQL